MKQVGELLPHDPTIAQRDELDRMLQRESQQKEQRLRKYVEIEQLWQLMSSMFGHKWTSSYGDESDPDRVWYAILKDITWNQMKSGMDRLAKSGREWPPAAPEFRKLCLGIEEGVNVARVPSVEATRERLKALTLIRTDEQRQEAANKIADIRGLLK